MLHSTKLADGQALACGLQFLGANLFLLAGLQALGGGLMRGGNRPVAGDVGLGLLIAVAFRL
jgi:hypothetical protein